MAETNAAVLIDNVEKSALEAQAENLIPPGVTVIPPLENVVPDTANASPALGLTDGAAVAHSNIIDMFGDSKVIAEKTEKQSAEKITVAPETLTVDELPENKVRNGKPSKADDAKKAPEANKNEKTPDTDKHKKAERAPRLPKGPIAEKTSVTVSGGNGGGVTGKDAGKKEPTPAPEPPVPPRDATRPGETEKIVYIDHAELHPFKGHPFKIRGDDAMRSLVESVKERGVDQPALVRPRVEGGYEIVAGHRRQYASELAGYANVPCVIRNMTDDEGVGCP